MPEGWCLSEKEKKKMRVGGGARGAGGEIEWGIDMRRREGMRRGRVQWRLIDSQE